MNENQASPGIGTEPTPPPPLPPRSRGRSPAPLIWGGSLLLLGAVLLLGRFDFFSRLGASLVPLVLLGGLAALCLMAFAAAPDRRFGFLVPAGFFASTAIIASGSIIGFLPGFAAPLVLFAGMAVSFAAIYLLDTRRRWASLAAVSCMVLGVAIFLSSLGRFGDAVSGTAFCWGAALVFVVHYLQSGREWPLLPAGGLATIGVIVLIDEIHLPERVIPMILFFGLAASFALYYLLGRPNRVRWAALPALLLAAFGLVALFSQAVITVGMPLLLIGFGLYLIVRSQRDAAAGDSGSAPGGPPAGHEAASNEQRGEEPETEQDEDDDILLRPRQP